MSIELQTHRLLLRRIVASDEDVQVRHYAEPESQQMILSAQRNSDTIRARFRNALENIGIQEASGDHHFSVVLAASGEIIGNCSAVGAYEESIETMLGWHLSVRFSRRGFGTEMVRELLRFCFEDTRSSIATADCFSDNIANTRVLEKAGMTTSSGRFSKWLLAQRYGEKRPISRYTLSRERWVSMRSQHCDVA